MRQQSAGSKLFTKMVYDGVNRETKRYLAYDTDETSYGDADDMTGNTELEQIETAYVSPQQWQAVEPFLTEKAT